MDLRILTEIVQDCASVAFADDPSVLFCPINHVTVAVYSPPPPSRVRDLTEMQRPARPNGFKQIPFHNDQVWKYTSKSKTPSFEDGKNSQTKNSCVCVLTWGDSRELQFRKFWKVPSTSSPEEEEKRYHLVKSFDLGHMSLFFLHPVDEEPKKRDLESFLSQFQHGNVKFGVAGTLSCALIFRSVTSTVLVNAVNGKLVQINEMNNIQKDRNDQADMLVNKYFDSGDANMDHIFFRDLFHSVAKRFE